MRKDKNLLAALQNLIDLNAPLIAVRVDFASENASGVSFASGRYFDMRGLSKCRPFES